MQVCYVDLGIEEKVIRSKVKSIARSFVELPVQVVECCLSETVFPGGPARSQSYDDAR